MPAVIVPAIQPMAVDVLLAGADVDDLVAVDVPLAGTDVDDVVAVVLQRARALQPPSAAFSRGLGRAF